MTIFFPDISQYTPVPLAGAPVALARATIAGVRDTHWQSNVDDAAAHGVPLLAYCFLNAGSLGVSPEAQADYAFSIVGNRPTMLDHEPNRGACASLAESLRWIDRFRSHGGVVHLDYLPRWAWSGTMGSPRLDALAARGMALVASNYTGYSDTGPGWAPYYPGCPVPVVQWQYSSTHNFNGVPVDWNAFRGTAAQYLELAQGGTADMTPDEHNRLVNIDEQVNKIIAMTSPARLTSGNQDNNLASTLHVIQGALASLATINPTVDVNALAAKIVQTLIADPNNPLTPVNHDALVVAVKDALREGVGAV